MEITNKDVKVLGRVAAITTEGVVASAEQVFDDWYGDSGEFQNVINQNFTDKQQFIQDQLTGLEKRHEDDILAVNQRIQTEVFPAISDVNDKLVEHTLDKNNPHSVTKAQVGLSNVDNTSDANKPISTAQQNKFDEVISDYTKKVSDESTARSNADKQLQSNIDDLATSSSEQLQAHISDTGNPHEVTKSQVGLGNVTNDAQVKRSEMGAANGVAQLGDDGRVPSSQLPSYVDDVLEYDNLASFPQTGESGKIYVAKDTNLTYRWSGSAYVEISQSLALGETSSTAYAGDKGKAVTDKVAEIEPDFNKLLEIASESGISLGCSSSDFMVDGSGDAVILTFPVTKFSDGEWKDPYSYDLRFDVATSTDNGMMSKADKAKLDGLNADPIQSFNIQKMGISSTDVQTYKFSINTEHTAELTLYSAGIHDAGLMSASDKSKLMGIEAEANRYILPAATTSTLGGVKVGSDLSVTADGVLSVNAETISNTDIDSLFT